jgi:CSLREA domain-containing protein
MSAIKRVLNDTTEETMNHKITFRLLFPFILAFITGLLATVVLIPVARAETITVNTTDDEVNTDGDCSLREAILAANSDTAVDACSAGNGDDVITLPPGLYTLTLHGAGEDDALTGDLDLTGNLTINGAGMNVSIIDGNGSDRIFDVHNGARVAISGVTVQNGNANSGAAINVLGALTLTGSRLTDNVAGSVGGAIYAGGAVTVTHSRIDGNEANGGGGIFVSFLPVTVEESEISGNHVIGGGGGIYSSGTLVVVNSTLSGNSAGGDGGGLYVVESNDNHLYNVTISANTAGASGGDAGNGGGVRVLGGLSTANTIIAGNQDISSGDHHPDCSGALNSEGYNLIGAVAGCTIGGDNTGNQIGVDPHLGPLQNNGGSTLTHALLGGSPARDGGDPGGCRDHDGALLVNDQRGFDRPGAGSALCDIGAYEEGSSPPSTATPTATPGGPPTATPTAPPPADFEHYLPLVLR